MTSPLRGLPRRLAAVASLSVLALGVAACSEEVPERTTPAGSTATEEAKPSADEPTSSDPTDGGSDTSQTTVPVYLVGDTPQGPKLFREFRAVPADNPLMEAASLILAGDALDPDYRTLWPPVEIASVQATDGVLLVEVPGDGFTERPDGMSKRDARLAIQQLVHTLQGVQQERVPVQFERSDTEARLFGLSTESPFTNAKDLKVSSLVNVTSPEQGSTVTGDTLAASGVASSFEATVPWEIRQGDHVVLEGFATAEGWMDRLYPWATEIDVSSLEPGTYEFAALTSDPTGGAEGPGPHEDTKDFVLQ